MEEEEIGGVINFMIKKGRKLSWKKYVAQRRKNAEKDREGEGRARHTEKDLKKRE